MPWIVDTLFDGITTPVRIVSDDYREQPGGVPFRVRDAEGVPLLRGRSIGTNDRPVREFAARYGGVKIDHWRGGRWIEYDPAQSLYAAVDLKKTAPARTQLRLPGVGVGGPGRPSTNKLSDYDARVRDS